MMHTGRIVAVRDAGLFDVEYDLGFDVLIRCTTRLVHPDTHEPMYTRDKSFGTPAKRWVNEWIVKNPVITVDVIRRINGTAHGLVQDGDTTLNQRLIDEGYVIDDVDKSVSKVPIYDRDDIQIPRLIIPDYDESQIVDTRRYL